MKTENKNTENKNATEFENVAKEDIKDSTLPIVTKEELLHKKFYIVSYAYRTTDYGQTAFVSISSAPNKSASAVFIASKVINEDIGRMQMPYPNAVTLIKAMGKNKREYYKLADIK